MACLRRGLGGVCLALLVAGAGAQPVPGPGSGKKLIELGWDIPTTAQLAAHAAEIDQAPFDGLVLAAYGTDQDGNEVSLGEAFSPDPWEAAWFQGARDDLRSCPLVRVTENFVRLGANPGNVDWFDPKWSRIVEHWRIAARFARESGLRGILFDPEPYTEGFRQFSWRHQPQENRHSFTEYEAQARVRGRQVMGAVAGEFPSIRILALFLLSQVVGDDGPEAGYGLLPAFLDGLLSEAPPTAVLVDGTEGAYLFDSRAEFQASREASRGIAASLLSAAHRPTYDRQVQTGFGLYLDAYVNPPGNDYFIGPRDGQSRLDRLRENLGSALRFSDGYVWIYGEKYRWWPTPNGSVDPRSWEAVLPGISGVLKGY